jgi:hypothetical protein
MGICIVVVVYGGSSVYHSTLGAIFSRKTPGHFQSFFSQSGMFVKLLQKSRAALSPDIATQPGYSS